MPDPGGAACSSDPASDRPDDGPSPGGGPLAGVRVVEFCGIGPGPHCAMLLSDLGAEVLRIDRPGGNGWPNPIVDRSRHVLELDIRLGDARRTVLEAIDRCDVFIEGFRPGVMERLGYDPEAMIERNPRLVFARMTGWGQTGPLAQTAGHDINYIALTGALAAITDKDGLPIPPLNLVGDFGGGSLFLAFGIVAALLERERSGQGQIVDAAIVDGVASMMTMFSGLLPAGRISLDPDSNPIGGRAPFYRCYECADGKHISIGPLEPQFHAVLLDRTGLPWKREELQYDIATWPERSDALETVFKRKTRDEWCTLLEGSDACFSPVLTYGESLSHPHLLARSTYVEVDGLLQAAPHPRFSRMPGAIGPSRDGEALLKRWTANSQACS